MEGRPSLGSGHIVFQWLLCKMQICEINGQWGLPHRLNERIEALFVFG